MQRGQPVRIGIVDDFLVALTQNPIRLIVLRGLTRREKDCASLKAQFRLVLGAIGRAYIYIHCQAL